MNGDYGYTLSNLPNVRVSKEDLEHAIAVLKKDYNDLLESYNLGDWINTNVSVQPSYPSEEEKQNCVKQLQEQYDTKSTGKVSSSATLCFKGICHIGFFIRAYQRMLIDYDRDTYNNYSKENLFKTVNSLQKIPSKCNELLIPNPIPYEDESDEEDRP